VLQEEAEHWHFVTLDAPALPGLTQNDLEPYAMALQAA
jgi:hypothetical protein